ncbi:MAG: SprT-like domain-containing protein, partial [Chloroflexota bacterium]
MDRHAHDAEPLAPVRISRRMTRTLGSYSPSKRQIAISHRLLNEGADEDVRAVLLHEVAHAIVHHRHGEARPHGSLFKQVCREIGAEPSARATVSLRPDRAQARYVFSCPGCKRTLSRKRLSRFARCRCGARLE